MLDLNPGRRSGALIKPTRQLKREMSRRLSVKRLNEPLPKFSDISIKFSNY